MKYLKTYQVFESIPMNHESIMNDILLSLKDKGYLLAYFDDYKRDKDVVSSRIEDERVYGLNIFKDVEDYTFTLNEFMEIIDELKMLRNYVLQYSNNFKIIGLANGRGDFNQHDINLDNINSRIFTNHSIDIIKISF